LVERGWKQLVGGIANVILNGCKQAVTTDRLSLNCPLGRSRPCVIWRDLDVG
jgi:hypothetical protein